MTLILLHLNYPLLRFLIFLRTILIPIFTFPFPLLSPPLPTFLPPHSIKHRLPHKAIEPFPVAIRRHTGSIPTLKTPPPHILHALLPPKEGKGINNPNNVQVLPAVTFQMIHSTQSVLSLQNKSIKRPPPLHQVTYICSKTTSI